MAILHHTVTLESHTEDHLRAANDWCLKMWPNTRGATWSRGWIKPGLITIHPMTCTWRFQREEDAVLFRTTWG